jgi:DNA-binding beta-propeller fold protein YncE
MEQSRIEDTLRRAYADAAATVQQDDIEPSALPRLQPATRSQLWAGRVSSKRRLIAAAAAVAAVAAVALVAGLIVPNALGPAMAAPRNMAYLFGSGSVLPVNLATGAVLKPIKLGLPASQNGPVGEVITPDGRTIYVATYSGYVVPIETATRTAGHPIRIVANPAGRLIGQHEIIGLLMSPDGQFGYVLVSQEGVAVVNFATNTLIGFVKTHDPARFALTPNGKTLYVINLYGSTVTPIDTATMTALPPIKTAGRDPLSAAIAAAPDGRTVYALVYFQHGYVTVHGTFNGKATSTKYPAFYDELTPISTASNAVLPSIKLPFLSEPEGSPITISPDSRSVYLSTESGVTAIDLATGKVSWTVKLGDTGPGSSYQIVVSPDGRTVYTNGANENVYRIKATTGAQLPPIATGWYTTDFALGPHGELYYLGYRGTNIPVSGPWALARFDAATGAASPIIHLPDAYPGDYNNLLFGPS